jgi:hypothetical protein
MQEALALIGDILDGLLDEAAEGTPATVFVEPEARVALLAQDIEPTPLIQLAQDRHSTKFSVPNQENSCIVVNQLAYIGQQSQMFGGTAVSSNMLDPGPGNRDRSFSVCQEDDQQLMPKAHLCPIHDQADFSQVPQLSFQPISSNRLVPFSHLDGGIIQQPAQSPSVAQQLSWTRDLPGNAAQAHRAALKNPNHQPNERAHLSNALSGSQFPNPANPGIIEMVGRHWITPFLKWLCKTYFSGESLPINYSIFKVSGS